jgi:hypothetical protein
MNERPQIVELYSFNEPNAVLERREPKARYFDAQATFFQRRRPGDGKPARFAAQGAAKNFDVLFPPDEVISRSALVCSAGTLRGVVKF